MKTINFLRPFTSTRIIKGTFSLAAADGGTRPGFAFGQRTHHFQPGQHALVSTIKDRVFVITDNPVAGEVVLDGAAEGVDFEVIAEGYLSATA